MQAKRDENDYPTALGVSSTDSITPIRFRVDPVTDRLLVEATVSAITAIIPGINKRDENDGSTVYGVSDVDGITPVPIRTDSIGRLLVSYT